MNVIIIGAGLAGLATAYRLKQHGIDAQVLEANSQPGGRIQPAIANSHQDLGPTWVWPYAQPVVTQWLNELNLKTFDQYDDGIALIDRDANMQAQQQDLPSQYGIARIEGGTHALIAKLSSCLTHSVKLEHIVKRCVYVNKQWQLTVSTANNGTMQFTCEKLIVSAPPRLGAAIIDTTEDSLTTALTTLSRAETWMAPHAKVVAVYTTAFWREMGLSGRVASHVGPLVEVHDHSGPDGTPAALFGFAGVPAHLRLEAKEQFVQAIKQQLKRCFGESAPEPIDIIIKDWAYEQFTTTDADRNGSGAHPPVLPSLARDAYCDESLWFGVSETSQRSPGLIEGALARADEVAADMIASMHN